MVIRKLWLPRRRRLCVFVAMVALMLIVWRLEVMLVKTNITLFEPTYYPRESGNKAYVFTTPIRDEIFPPRTTDAKARARINVLDVAKVERVVDDVRCVPLQTADDKPICFDTKDNFIGPSIARRWSGTWERYVWEPMVKLLSEDPELCLIDIGANIGVFTINVAALGRRVVAVEAFYENIQRMSESLRLGGLVDKVTLVHNAVSDVYEDVSFWKPDDNPGGTHTLSKGITLSPNQPLFQGQHSSVATIYLNDLINILPFNKAIMKMDIEGYENNAFKKAKVLLDSVDIKAIFMEFTLVRASADVMNIVRVLTERGYRAHSLIFQPLGEVKTRADLGPWPRDIIWIKNAKPAESTEKLKTIDNSGEISLHKVDLRNGFSINIMDTRTVPSVSNYVSCVALRTASGNRICIDIREQVIAPAMVKNDAWKPYLWTKISEFLKTDNELGLLDIGAGVGELTLSAAAMGRPVLAVEADYENIQRLSESLRLGRLTDKVSVVYNAVWDVYEYVGFTKPRDQVTRSFRANTMEEGLTKAVNMIRESLGLTPSPQQKILNDHRGQVGTIFLDDLVRVARFKKAIMKIDIGDDEKRAFRKIEKLLDGIQIKALFMEWQSVKASPDCWNIFKIMTARNYRATDMNSINLEGSTLKEVQNWPGDIIWVKE